MAAAESNGATVSEEPEPAQAIGADPRLLLPEWLRDSDAREPSSAGSAGHSDETGKVAHPDSGYTPAVPATTVESPPAVEAQPSWPSPPPPVDRIDPAALIRPEDIPAWIRALVDAHPEPPATSPPLASGIDPVSATTIEAGLVSQAATLSILPASAVSPTTPVIPTEAEGSPPPEDVTASPSVAAPSDLTLPRFILLAGVTLLLIVLAVAVLYF
jgi:hypothetical protein